jgi:uncharacterized integral membrane protein (TIGR00698 family)
MPHAVDVPKTVDVVPAAKPRTPARMGWLPGLGAAFGVALLARAASDVVPGVSSLLLAVLAGMIACHVGLIAPVLEDGLKIAAKRLMRIGVVLLGVRLSFDQLVDLGVGPLLVVATTVAATFFGTQWLGRRLGMSRDLSLLLATGYSICGASAIAAVEGTTDADEDEVAAAIGLVTLFGTLSMIALPVVAGLLSLDDSTAGSWIGAATHDVAQVVAGASTIGSAAVTTAVVVKLARVVMLAPLVAGVSMHRRRTSPASNDTTSARPPIMPLFVVGFLAAIALRSTGVLSDDVVGHVKTIEGIVLATAMVGLGAGVKIATLRRLGTAPLRVGALAWLLVSGVALAGAVLVA